MGASIIGTTRRFIAELDADTLASAESSAHELTLLDLGRSMKLQETLELLTVAKRLAVGDDFRRGEGPGLRLWLTKYEMPDAVWQHLQELDTRGMSLDELGARFTPDGIETRRLLWLVAALASFEGLRQGARNRAVTLSVRLGLAPGLARVLIEEAQIAVSAMLGGDEPLMRRLRMLRAAIFELGAVTGAAAGRRPTPGVGG
ncbi:MAG: hypothetical protein KDK70_07490 [Myxococcales bacterium]|nr:hypothetical protein [Myxococcales bacterium]